MLRLLNCFTRNGRTDAIIDNGHACINKLRLQMAADKYTFYYFPVKGRGQAIRYIFVDKGLNFEEVKIEESNWVSKYKPKAAFGQVPMLVDGDVELVQSNAILRYLGRKHGLYPDDFKEGAHVDMVNDHTEDIRIGYTTMIYRNYEAGKDGFIQELAGKLEPLEKLFKSWGNDYISSEISYADYNLFDLLDALQILSPGCLDAFPTLKAYFSRIEQRPLINKYRATDDFTKFPINGNGKQ